MWLDKTAHAWMPSAEDGVPAGLLTDNLLMKTTITSVAAATNITGSPNSGAPVMGMGQEGANTWSFACGLTAMKVGQTFVVIVQRLSAPESTLPLYRRDRS